MAYDLRVVRFSARADGIFGAMLWRKAPFGVCVEHSFLQPDGSHRPIIPDGEYDCVPRKYNKGGYQTFEIVGVEGHELLLFHKGNTEDDSRGCVLTGEQFEPWKDGRVSVQLSGHAFEELMRLTGGKAFRVKFESHYDEVTA